MDLMCEIFLLFFKLKLDAVYFFMPGNKFVFLGFFSLLSL